jgi:hypothetical protein
MGLHQAGGILPYTWHVSRGRTGYFHSSFQSTEDYNMGLHWAGGMFTHTSAHGMFLGVRGFIHSSFQSTEAYNMGLHRAGGILPHTWHVSRGKKGFIHSSYIAGTSDEILESQR